MAQSSSSGHNPLPFSGPSFSASVPLCYPSTIPTLNTFVPLMQWSTSYLPLFVGKTHQLMGCLVRLAADWQRCISWRTHATQRLDSGLPSHASRTSRSIKEARQPPTLPWSPYRARCRRKAERPHVFAQSREWERVAPLTPKLTPQLHRWFQKAHGPSS